MLTGDSLSVQVLFQLIRIALGKEEPSSLPNDINWQEVYDLSLKQGVGAIACDGMLALKDCDIDEELRYKWMGQSMVIEQKYLIHKRTVTQLADFYRQCGISMMLLKGYGLSLNYPIPAHRPSGDIDIFLLQNRKSIDGRETIACGNDIALKGDGIISSRLQLKVSKARMEHHSHFCINDITVENHYEIGNTYHKRKTSILLEQQLQQLIQRGTMHIVDGSIVMPSPTFNAVFLINHLHSHFISDKVSIRQLLDWALFVDKHNVEIDWDQVFHIWKQSGLCLFANTINSVLERFGITIGNADICKIDESERGCFLVNDMLGDTKRGYGPLSNLTYYYKQRKKYALFHESNWVIRMIGSIKLHFFHSNDMKKKQVLE